MPDPIDDETPALVIESMTEILDALRQIATDEERTRLANTARGIYELGRGIQGWPDATPAMRDAFFQLAQIQISLTAASYGHKRIQREIADVATAIEAIRAAG